MRRVQFLFRYRIACLMTIFRSIILPALASAALILPSTAQAAGDLLVAPTRVVLNGNQGTEVILNNIGNAPATYRISLELRRMTPDGQLEEIDPANATLAEQQVLEMIRYAPSRVVLPPDQPQAIRIGVRMPEGLPDGEYRAHMLLRAIPEAQPVVDSGPPTADGLVINLTPVYGVTIPVIVRKGDLSAQGALKSAALVPGENGPMLAVQMGRTGNRSTYGEIRVTRTGASEPVMIARGIAVYPEINERTVMLPLAPGQADAMRGAVQVEYREPVENGGQTIARLDTVLN